MLSNLINPLHMGMALGPLAVYLLVLGIVNLSRRPFLTTGARDTAALGIGISGLVIVGPLRLLMPIETFFVWGGLLWLLLLAFYGLTLTLVVLMLRPRLVIYNIKPDTMRPLLAEVVGRLDPEARWAGECLVLPQLQVQLHLDTALSMRNVQLVAAGPRQNFEGWRKLEAALSAALQEAPPARNPLGFSFLIVAAMLGGLITLWMARDPATLAQAVHEMLQFPAPR